MAAQGLTAVIDSNGWSVDRGHISNTTGLEGIE